MGTKASPSAFDCFSKAAHDELMFVLLGRDPMAAQLVEMWCTGAELRLSSQIEQAKANGATDADIAAMPEWPRERDKIAEAHRISEEMAAYCRSIGKLPMRWSGVAPVITRAAPKTAITREQVKSLCALSLSLDADRLILELARAAGVPE